MIISVVLKIVLGKKGPCFRYTALPCCLAKAASWPYQLWIESCVIVDAFSPPLPWDMLHQACFTANSEESSLLLSAVCARI